MYLSEKDAEAENGRLKQASLSCSQSRSCSGSKRLPLSSNGEFVVGDLSTHKAIFQTVALPVLLGLGLTNSQAQCFELGNWLRDVSQFRDPYAFQLKKIDIYRTKVIVTLRGEVVSHPWVALLDEIFGPNLQYDKDASIVTGALGEWFRNIILASGLASFGLSIPEADFARLFSQYFTQYYPHEHLDFPPTGDPKLLGDWSRVSEHTQGGGPKRRVLFYLEEFIDYIATQLLQAEVDLGYLLSFGRPSRTNKISPVEWNKAVQNSLIALGKASHAIEDYYFHSNFSELAFLPEHVGLPTYYNLPQARRLREPYKRIMFRRTRAPRLAMDKDGNSAFDTSGSEYAKHIFTGMFGGDDVLYTFGDAFESFASWAAQADRELQKHGVQFKDLFDSTLFKYLLDPNLRKKLVKTDGGIVVSDQDKIDEVNDQHIRELKEERLVDKANKVATVAGLSPLFTASIRRANQVDLVIAIKAAGRVLQNFSIGKVLLFLVSNVEAAEQNSSRVAETLNKAPRDLYYLASNNPDTAENIGSHTLMAKDSERKLPLRAETDDFARFAVGIVMKTLARQVAMPAPPKKRVDWGELLRRLLCHPAQAPNDWAKKMLAKQVVPPTTFEPKFINLHEAEEASRAGPKLRAKLEESYRNLYTKEAALWTKEVQAG
jgi:hypothetical protein